MSHDLQGIELPVDHGEAFDLIADPFQLPRWTRAFSEVDGGSAVMRTPAGEVTVALRVDADRSKGTVDWTMTFPDGSQARAFSRVVPLGAGRCHYSLVLTPPPVPLEDLEGTLEEQSRTLREELKALARLLGSHDG